MKAVLLLSGGLDSTALAAWKRPSHCLVVDYGQRSAEAETRAAGIVADRLGLPLARVRVDCSVLGQGDLAGSAGSEHSRHAEWWPYRNQLLVTFAAAWALQNDHDTVWTGTILTDDRHADGTRGFYERLDDLLSYQEGGVRVSAPAGQLDCEELVTRSGVTDDVLAWTHSCHTGNLACGHCAGCRKRTGVLRTLGRLT